MEKIEDELSQLYVKFGLRKTYEVEGWSQPCILIDDG
jgi:hypothetical protein